MPTVKLDQIAEGMCVIHPVVNHLGQVIIESGEEVTEKHLRVFRMWGITEVNVKSETGAAHADSAVNNIPQEIIDQARIHVKNRFRHTHFTDPAIHALAKINLNTTIRRLMKEAAHE